MSPSRTWTRQEGGGGGGPPRLLYVCGEQGLRRCEEYSIPPSQSRTPLPEVAPNISNVVTRASPSKMAAVPLPCCEQEGVEAGRGMREEVCFWHAEGGESGEEEGGKTWEEGRIV